MSDPQVPDFTNKRLLKSALKLLTDVIENGEEVVTEAGEIKRKTASPAFLGHAIGFLKLVGENGAEDKKSLADKLRNVQARFPSKENTPEDTPAPDHGFRH